MDDAYPESRIYNEKSWNKGCIVNLALRRDCASIFFLYKLLNNLINYPDMLFQIIFNAP